MLSALFSGSETGFYRHSVTKLKLDAISGDRISMILLWLSNHPSFFVATVLTGNNMANYVVSISEVLLIQHFFGASFYAEMLGALLLTPLLFVYGEMFPKNMFLHTPNKLLRKSMPFIMFFAVLFLPITLILWGINRIMSILIGRSRQMVRLTLARKELAYVLDEGQEAGVLLASQRRLAAGVFDAATQNISKWILPLDHFPILSYDLTPKEASMQIMPAKSEHIPVCDARKSLIGYIRPIELIIAEKHEGSIRRIVHPFLEIQESYSPLTAMCLFQSTGETLGIVRNESKQWVGFLLSEHIQNIFVGE